VEFDGGEVNGMGDWQGRINSDPQRMTGQPCIKGTRITVGLVLRKLSGGMSVDEFVEQYPHVKREDVLAALAYASDRIEETAAVGG
jgi:uncharacterized protein (DUF433 family)